MKITAITADIVDQQREAFLSQQMRPSDCPAIAPARYSSVIITQLRMFAQRVISQVQDATGIAKPA